MSDRRRIGRDWATTHPHPSSSAAFVRPLMARVRRRSRCGAMGRSDEVELPPAGSRYKSVNHVWLNRIPSMKADRFLDCRPPLVSAPSGKGREPRVSEQIPRDRAGSSPMGAAQLRTINSSRTNEITRRFVDKPAGTMNHSTGEQPCPSVAARSDFIPGTIVIGGGMLDSQRGAPGLRPMPIAVAFGNSHVRASVRPGRSDGEQAE